MLVQENSSIRDAMEIIDIGSLKLAFVVDKKNHLIATVSDGDIRRGLLNGLSLDYSINTVMNSDPYTLNLSSSHSERVDLLRDKKLNCIPIVSNGNEIVDIFTLDNLNEYVSRENPVFIMAGGFGTRLKPLTDNCPKPMLPVGGVPLLELTLTRLKKQGFSNFIISTHFLPEIIQDHFLDGSNLGVEIVYVHESQPLGTGGALSLLPEKVPKIPLIILNGDILTDLDFTKLLNMHESKNFDVTMCLKEIETQISYGVVETEDGIVTSLKEKPAYRHNINTGIYVVSPDFVRSMKYNRKIDMPEHIKVRIDNGFKVGSMKHPGYWLDIGRVADYEKAQNDVAEFLTEKILN